MITTHDVFVLAASLAAADAHYAACIKTLAAAANDARDASLALSTARAERDSACAARGVARAAFDAARAA